MADNVIPFPIQRRQAEIAQTGSYNTETDVTTVTREEMIQLVLRYAYGTRWADEPRTAVKAKDD